MHSDTNHSVQKVANSNVLTFFILLFVFLLELLLGSTICCVTLLYEQIITNTTPWTVIKKNFRIKINIHN
jgi:hypothetical protein